MMRSGLVRGLTMGALGLAACSGEGPTTYTLTFAGTTPTALVAQDGDGAWQSVTYAAGGATFEVTAGFHGWAATCGGRAFVVSRHDAGDRGRPIEPCGGTPITLAHLRGQITPITAELYVGLDGVPDQAAADGSYDAAVAPGSYDLVALATDGPRALIRRGQDIAADTTLDLDLSTGFDRVLAPATVTGAGADPVTLGSELHTHDGAGTYVPMTGTSDSIWVVPAAQRVATDRMVAIAYARTSATTRVVQRVVLDATVPVLPFAPLPTLAADQTGATWSSEPDWIYATLRSTTNATVLSMVASREWQAARGGDGALPWFDPTVVGAPTFAAGTPLTWEVGVEIGDRAGELALDGSNGTLTW